jgi:hypothetical protein
MEELLRGALDRIQDGVLIIQNKNIIFINNSALLEMKLVATNAIGRAIDSLPFCKYEAKFFSLCIDKCLKTGNPLLNHLVILDVPQGGRQQFLISLYKQDELSVCCILKKQNEVNKLLRLSLDED